jgi:hypothetical protein
MIASGESVLLSETAMVRARSFHNDEWSALTEASFIVGQPASSANLAVSELYYNPPGADEGTEFIELMNTDPTSSIDLTNVSLQGVDYTFPAGIVLSPGERMVIARNRTAFTAAHPLESEHLAPGEYGGSSLSNEGEEIVVLAQDGITEIRRFTYDDKAPWPLSADGAGYSLVLIAPEENPDHGEPFNWRPSTGLAGNPGGSDRAPAFVGSPDLDADLDGFSAFFEHATGTSDEVPNARSGATIGTAVFDDGNGSPGDHLVLSYQRNLAADDVLYEVQASTGLQPAGWNSGPGFVEFVSMSNNGDGTATVTYRSTRPYLSVPHEFLRLKVRARP